MFIFKLNIYARRLVRVLQYYWKIFSGRWRKYEKDYNQFREDKEQPYLNVVLYKNSYNSWLKNS
jgi:hypothetical protein